MPAAAVERQYAAAARDREPAAVLRPIATWRPPILVHLGPATLTQQHPMPARPHREQMLPVPAHRVARLPQQHHVAAVAAAKPAAAAAVDMPVPAAHRVAAAVAANTGNL
jgi:hypothetical protein